MSSEGDHKVTRVNLVVEGPTEETFIKRVLSPFLASNGIFVVSRSVQTSRTGGRGGLSNYILVKNDILNWLKQDTDAYVSTMFDLYALPKSFPGWSTSQEQSDPYKKAESIETELKNDINHDKFIPHIQLYEFEGLLFSDIDKIDLCMSLKNQNGQVSNLRKSVSSFSTPEHINDNYTTAPSRRLKSFYPGYDKVLFGSLISEDIGIATIMNKCKHFSCWVNTLKDLGPSVGNHL